MRHVLLFALLAGLVAAAPDDDAAAARGKELFFDNQDLEYPSCADCHSLLPEKEEKKKAKHLGPGATLYGAVLREGWRNMNTYKDVGEASQTCAKKWQRRKKGLKAAQRADLIAFLKTAAPAKGPLPKRKVRRPKVLKNWSGGDAKKGKALSARYCMQCHHAGDDSLSFELKPNHKRKDLLARTVRGYNNKMKFKPKTMSYYTVERLPDADLKHIIAYLGR